jgi:hypothetical protein
LRLTWSPSRPIAPHGTPLCHLNGTDCVTVLTQ